jgi:hypothetical protein
MVDLDSDGFRELCGRIEFSCTLPESLEHSSHSFNKCLAVNNNAGLAFDRTYTEYYPLAYQIFVAEGRDPKVTIEAIRKGLAVQPESEALARLQQLASQGSSGSTR